MIDINAWAASGAGLLGAAVAAVNGGALFRTHLRQRALERERSARSIAQMFDNPHVGVRVVEQDAERLIEIGGPAGSAETAA